VQEGKRKLVREFRRGDVVLMMLLARKETRWHFGSTRKRKKSGSGRGNETRRCWWSMKLERRSGGGG
jgi:hypothetical protein